ncbi:MAG: glycosyltransferase family 4 protein [Saprospiraceae bacterium]
MKIALYSPNFLPLTGGLENVVHDLATGFSEAGHTATVVTATPADAPDGFPFRVLRRAGFFGQVAAMRCADVVLMFNVSLWGVLPWLVSGRPLVVSHHTPNSDDRLGRLKAWVARRLAARNATCSVYLARQFDGAVPLPNPYDDAVFRSSQPWVFRRRDFVFVGRLVSDKGADLLLAAMALLQDQGHKPGLTIVGSGPEEAVLRQQARELGLEEQVVFVGEKKGPALAAVLNEHRFVAVPSRWAEPFGLVMLEGLACGCIAIGSDGGGLPEALGGLGLTFPNNNAPALAACLRQVVENPLEYLPEPEKLAAHLRRHERAAAAQAYLDFLLFPHIP